MLVIIYWWPTLGVATEYRKPDRNATQRWEIAGKSVAGRPGRALMMKRFDRHLDDGRFLARQRWHWLDGAALERYVHMGEVITPNERPREE